MASSGSSAYWLIYPMALPVLSPIHKNPSNTAQVSSATVSCLTCWPPVSSPSILAWIAWASSWKRCGVMTCQPDPTAIAGTVSQGFWINWHIWDIDTIPHCQIVQWWQCFGCIIGQWCLSLCTRCCKHRHGWKSHKWFCSSSPCFFFDWFEAGGYKRLCYLFDLSAHCLPLPEASTINSWACMNASTLLDKLQLLTGAAGSSWIRATRVMAEITSLKLGYHLI